jgi:hypothetical protein
MREESRIIEHGRNRFGPVAQRRLSWSAIFAGVAVTLGVSILLGLLGAGVGAGTIDPLQERDPLQGLGMGALVWMVVSGIIAFFSGGWVAGYGSGWPLRRTDTMIHGLATWAVATVVGLWVITGAAGSLLSGSTALLGHAISGGAQAAGQSPELSDRLRQELERRGIDTKSLEQAAQTPEAKARAEQMAREAGQAVATGVSRAALGAFGLLLVDLIACLIGAAVAFYPGGREVTTTTERAA